MASREICGREIDGGPCQNEPGSSDICELAEACGSDQGPCSCCDKCRQYCKECV